MGKFQLLIQMGKSKENLVTLNKCCSIYTHVCIAATTQFKMAARTSVYR